MFFKKLSFPFTILTSEKISPSIEGKGTPLQYSCLENPMDGGAWKAAVHGVAEGRTRLNNFDFSRSCIGEGNGSPLQCSCLENPRDGGTWWAAVYGVTQSRTRLKRLSSSSSRKLLWASQVALVLENPPANAGTEETAKIPWRRTEQPTPLFLPGESHGEKTGGLQSTGWQTEAT